MFYQHIGLRLSVAFATVALVTGAANAVPALIAGVDFANAQNAFDITPDDLNVGDGITVSAWTFTNGGGISNDGNAQTGRASAPVGKFNGEDNATQPSVGAAAPVNNVHSFSITIPNGVFINLDDVSFDYSQATNGANTRWIAFKTSLDATLIFSEVGPLRPTLDSEFISLTGAQYKNLTNQVVAFQWYAGGPGTGDIDIDSIVIRGSAVVAAVVVPEPATATLAIIGMAGLLARRRRMA